MSNDASATDRSRHISRVIACPPERVYDFAADPANLPRWAAGLAGRAVVPDGDSFLADSPMGRVRVRFTARNALGVLDHDVTLPSGATVYNPVRVIAHPAGSEIVFTIRRLAMTAEEFDRDSAMVAADLDRLAAILES
ncbi:SRPBCC family protein [Nocardia higoensis]|uniref:SRPBCC family protein n=1 Tax=Nocardia higoensis TaxID=228599 RepID=UPI00157696BC|nr:SRPBCC family protein [Nocardia higoensis]